MTAIGGHEGMTVYREDGAIVKEATTPEAWAGLQREDDMLLLMRGRHAPDILAVWNDERCTFQEDCGDSLSIDPMQSPERGADGFLVDCIAMLRTFHQAGVRHGDLTPPNLAYRKGELVALDWQEAHRFDEPPIPKRQTSDAWQLLDTYCNMTGDPRRIARRWMAMLRWMGGATSVSTLMARRGFASFLDLGAYDGMMVALANASGFYPADGVDLEPQPLPCPVTVWTPDLSRVLQDDIPDWIGTTAREFDAIAMLSTFAWIAEGRGGWERAKASVEESILRSKVLFFETQLHGDGPGPEQFKTDDDVLAFLEELGAQHVEAILTLDIGGRDAKRTLWAVR